MELHENPRIKTYFIKIKFSSELAMALSTSNTSSNIVTVFELALIFFFFHFPSSSSAVSEADDQLFAGKLNGGGILPKSDVDLLEFPLNLEFLEAEFFLWGSMSRGLDSIAPELASGGPSPIGPKRARLSPLIRDIVDQFGLQEVGHLRAIKKTVPGFPRPLLNLSVESFATIMNDAFGQPLVPPFDPYANDINYLIASYVIPYVGLTGYVGANPKLQSPAAKRLVAGLLGVESGQDAVLRALLYDQARKLVEPYGITVAEFTNRISKLRNKLGNAGLKDEGLVVTPAEGAEGRTRGNVLAGDQYSLSFGRTPEEILRIVYGSGKEGVTGGFYPKGADGRIATSYLKQA